MDRACDFFVEELREHFAGQGKTLSLKVIRVLGKEPSEFDAEDREAYARLVQPAEGYIRRALRERLGRDGERLEQWQARLAPGSRTVIEGLVREVLESMGMPPGGALGWTGSGKPYALSPESAERPAGGGVGSEAWEGGGERAFSPQGSGTWGTRGRETESRETTSRGTGSRDTTSGGKENRGMGSRRTARKGTGGRHTRSRGKGSEDMRSESVGRNKGAGGKETVRKGAWRKLLRILQWATTLLVALFVLLAVFLIVAPSFGVEAHPVLSGSMEPALKVGGIIICRNVPVADIKEGDIIGFNLPGGEKVTHRVIAVMEENGKRYFQTKGDANEDPDSDLVAISGEKVDKVVFHLPYLGFVSRFMQSRLAFLVFICAPALILALLFGRDLWQGFAELRARKARGGGKMAVAKERGSGGKGMCGDGD